MLGLRSLTDQCPSARRTEKQPFTHILIIFNYKNGPDKVEAEQFRRGGAIRVGKVRAPLILLPPPREKQRQIPKTRPALHIANSVNQHATEISRQSFPPDF